MENIKNGEAGLGRRFMCKDRLKNQCGQGIKKKKGVSWRVSKVTQNDWKDVFG